VKKEKRILSKDNLFILWMIVIFMSHILFSGVDNASAFILFISVIGSFSIGRWG